MKITPAIPSGKTGTALGPMPAPSTPVVGQSLRSSPPKSSEHKHTANKPAHVGRSSTPLLPSAPKFETNKKIPPFGSSLNGAAANHNHGGAKPDAGHQHPITSKPAAKPRDDHDHDHRDRDGRRDGHSGHNHAGSSHRHDSHDDHDHHHHHHYGSSRRGGWSWLILGGLGSSGGGWYGPGYGQTYGGWTNDAYYVPAQTYVPAVSASVPVVVDSSTLPQPAQSVTEDFSMLPIARQRELLMQALNALEDDFARSPNGDEWSRHLQLATVAKLIGEGDAPTDPVTRARLRSVVELFDEVAANSDYRAVSDLLSFRSLQSGLREFASEPIGQARGRLSRTADRLSQRFKAWPNGDRWMDYLQVAWLVGTEEEDRIEMAERLVRFEKVLAKFDRIQSDEQFKVVSEDPAFGPTHAALRGFVRELRLVVMPIDNKE